MKKILIFILFTTFYVFGYSQQITKYSYEKGKEKSITTWSRSTENGMTVLKTTKGSVVHEYHIDNKYATVLWRYTDTDNKTDLTAKINAGNYSIKGQLKGKAINKSIQSNGVPWYQNIGYNIGYSMNGKKSYKFEMIRPDNLELYEMQADKKESEVIDGISTQRINVHFTGFLTKYFGTDYYINSKGQFVLYKGVHGPPGTPETIIKLLK